MSRKNSEFIAHEMREANLGSFPLSPGIMTGHYLVADLYWYYRQDLLKELTIPEVFGTNNPEPYKLTIPKGHRSLTSPEGLNNSVWKSFLDKVFLTHPDINKVEKVRSLISVNANSDKTNLEKRITGEKSKIAQGDVAPSLLRAFVFEGRFPFKENEFFIWLFAEMAQEIIATSQGNFTESWSNGLQGLVLMWNAKFPDNPFIPKDQL